MTGETLADANRRAINHLRDRIDQLETERDDLKDRVNELEDLIGADLAELEYEQYTKQDKVRIVRDKLAEKAHEATNGKAAMNYKEVIWLFDGQPSPGHAYDLMEHAGSAAGYNYETSNGKKSNRITVNIADVKVDDGFHAANKTPEQTTP